MLGIFEAEMLADHCDGQRLVVQQLFSMGEKAVRDDVLSSTPRFHTHQIAEIATGQAAFVSKIGYCRQTILKGFCGDVIINQFYESLYHSMIDFLAGDKLAVIEAETIVQQQLDVGNDEFACMLIDSVMQFLLYHGEHSTKDFHFLSGEMQSLGAGIAEELIAAYLSA